MPRIIQCYVYWIYVNILISDLALVQSVTNTSTSANPPSLHNCTFVPHAFLEEPSLNCLLLIMNGNKTQMKS